MPYRYWNSQSSTGVRSSVTFARRPVTAFLNSPTRAQALKATQNPNKCARETTTDHRCDHAVTHTYHTPVSTMTIATSMLDHSANAMESDAVLPKDVDGTPRLLITKMVRPLDCAGVTSRQRTMMNEISNPFYPTIVFVIRNWKTLKVMREQKSLVRSTNVSVPWLARTAVGNQTSLMQCCSSLANAHRSCDSRKYQN